MMIDKATTSSISRTVSRRSSSNRKKQPEQQQQEQQQQKKLDELLAKIDKYMALDQILEARKVVNTVLEDESLGVRLTSTQHSTLQDIVVESNHVSDLLHDIMSDDDGWILAKRKHGVTVHYRHESDSPIHAVKTRYVFHDAKPEDFVHLVSVFNESDLMPLWFPNNVLKEAICLAKPSNYHQVLQMKINMGRLSPISPRDSILDGHGYHLSDRNGIIVFSKSITESPYCEIPPPDPRTIRMETRNAFFVQLLPNSKMVFCQISHDDLKIKYMPSWLLNIISEGAIPFEVVQSLRNCLTNFKGSLWEERIKSRRDVYEEIENRLSEELEIMKNKQQQQQQQQQQFHNNPAAAEKNILHEQYEWAKDIDNGEMDNKETKQSSVFWNITLYIVALIAVFVMITSFYDDVAIVWKLFAAFVAIIVTRLFLRRKHSANRSGEKVKDKTTTTIPPNDASQQSSINNAIARRDMQRSLPAPTYLNDNHEQEDGYHHHQQQQQQHDKNKKSTGVKRILKKVVLAPVGIVKFPIQKIRKRRNRHRLQWKTTNDTAIDD